MKLLCGLMLLAAWATVAAWEQFIVEPVELDNTHATVHSVGQIVQDTNGFIWVATAVGLIRYDGARSRQRLKTRKQH